MDGERVYVREREKEGRGMVIEGIRERHMENECLI